MTRYDDNDHAKMLELAAMGYNHPAIARRFGCSPTYVADVLQGNIGRRVEEKKIEQSNGRRPPKWLASLPHTVDLSGVE